ncbi:unnamed protein product [Leptidea sinapis]|uniref:Neutral ceramidase n=1 Tax=Leptidea sinapis TaxID=189913 RepID=A0A5E4R4Y7_9NEOP|nr:unnamed protein product [Leptidea sinapis]
MTMLVVVAFVCAFVTAAHPLRVGTGIADITGPPAEIRFMGYANFEQIGNGIHLRQFSRAFVFDEGPNSSTRFVFVSVDACMMADGLRKEVIKRLQKRYGDIYNENNVIISGTHTHSTPGGFLMYFLFELPILGFVKETYTAYIAGILKSIIIAHNNLTPARMEFGEGELLNANINRSPSSYLRNPPEERARYKYDVDKTLTQVRFLSPSNDILGVINWFPVHPTSMNNTNKLISSDNVGYASILMEKALNGNNTLPGKGRIVCAFASTNLGDVSPNIRGPRCEFSRKVCNQEDLLCTKPKERCFASGPGRDMFESTKIIATRLFETAMKVLQQPGEDLTGPVGIVHQYVHMPSQSAPSYDPVEDTFTLLRGGYHGRAGRLRLQAGNHHRQPAVERHPGLPGRAHCRGCAVPGAQTHPASNRQDKIPVPVATPDSFADDRPYRRAVYRSRTGRVHLHVGATSQARADRCGSTPGRHRRPVQHLLRLHHNVRGVSGATVRGGVHDLRASHPRNIPTQVHHRWREVQNRPTSAIS